MPKTIGTYKPNKSNITTSISIRTKDESDYLELRKLISQHRISMGEYLVSSYRELDKGASNDFRLKTLKYN